VRGPPAKPSLSYNRGREVLGQCAGPGDTRFRLERCVAGTLAGTPAPAGTLTAVAAGKVTVRN
jgi:hypothetical protein